MRNVWVFFVTLLFLIAINSPIYAGIHDVLSDDSYERFMREYQAQHLTEVEVKLLETCAYGTVQDLECFLKSHKHLQLNIFDQNGLTPLTWAIDSRDSQKVQILLNYRPQADPNFGTVVEPSPLWAVIEEYSAYPDEGERELLDTIVRLLVEAGADVNYTAPIEDWGQTPVGLKTASVLDLCSVYRESFGPEGSPGDDIVAFLREHGALYSNEVRAFTKPCPVVHGKKQRITAKFGQRTRFTLYHTGIDVALPVGTPVYAPTDGKVQIAGWHRTWGKWVVIAGHDGRQYRLAHLSRMVVQEGQDVRAGQIVGYSGATGLATGPHLHIGVLQNGLPVDPDALRLF